MLNKNKAALAGASSDAILLAAVKIMTLLLGIVTTRLMSQHLSVYDYGTYSLVLLVANTTASITILGMMDGINYFFCSEKDAEKREAYLSTIYLMQCLVSAVAGCTIMGCAGVISSSFGNPEAKKWMIFSAILPFLQNILSMTQVLLMSVGKARLLAVRNLTVSLLKLGTVLVVVLALKRITVILMALCIMDAAQILLFAGILKKNGCIVRLRSASPRLLRRILHYCVPMAVFILLNTINRDCDKYIIAAFTDTEILAVYSNASKMLPFDIVMASFITVLLPQITRLIAEKRKKAAAALYRAFLEVSYISTGILTCAALTAAPQLMELLYTKKYLSGLTVFILYILVDLLRFTNITLILSAAGKTRTLMGIAVGSVVVNFILNIFLFRWIGIPGLALATLLVTCLTGIWLLYFSARELNVGLCKLFDGKYLLFFALTSFAGVAVLKKLVHWLVGCRIHYILILLLVGALYVGGMCLLNGNRLLWNFRKISSFSKKENG